jgi:hypothetical protein
LSELKADGGVAADAAMIDCHESIRRSSQLGRFISNTWHFDFEGGKPDRRFFFRCMTLVCVHPAQPYTFPTLYQDDLSESDGRRACHSCTQRIMQSSRTPSRSHAPSILRGKTDANFCGVEWNFTLLLFVLDTRADSNS